MNFFREETNAISTLPVFPISTDISGDFIGSLPSFRRRNRHKCRSPNGNRDNFGCITLSQRQIPCRKRCHYSFEIITGVAYVSSTRYNNRIKVIQTVTNSFLILLFDFRTRDFNSCARDYSKPVKDFRRFYLMEIIGIR